MSCIQDGRDGESLRPQTERHNVSKHKWPKKYKKKPIKQSQQQSSLTDQIKKGCFCCSCDHMCIFKWSLWSCGHLIPFTDYTLMILNVYLTCVNPPYQLINHFLLLTAVALIPFHYLFKYWHNGGAIEPDVAQKNLVLLEKAVLQCWWSSLTMWARKGL